MDVCNQTFPVFIQGNSGGKVSASNNKHACGVDPWLKQTDGEKKNNAFQKLHYSLGEKNKRKREGESRRIKVMEL